MEGLEGTRDGMSDPQPPDEGLSATLDDTMRKAVARVHRATDEMGAALASSSITPGENLRLEPEMANAVLTRAQDLLYKLRSVQSDSDALRHVKPAAADRVSTRDNKKLTTTGDFASAVAPSVEAGAFDAGVSQLDAAISYLETYIDKLNEALGKTQATDTHHGEVLTKAGQPQEQKPGGMVG